MVDRLNAIAELKSILCDVTDECFYVNTASDSAGSHFCLYLIRDSFDLSILWQKIDKLNLRRCIIVYCNQQQIEALNSTKGNE